MKTRLLLVLSAGLFLAADDEAVKKEYKNFTGTWTIVSIEIEGMKQPDEIVKGYPKLLLKGDQFTMDSPGGAHKGTYKVDLAKKPKQMDITFTDGPEKGKTLLGIYELNGDTYKVCLAMADNKNRPTEFASKPGSGNVLEVLKREKP
jgi:uncharacterized protein (TIGR03067 family)